MLNLKTDSRKVKPGDTFVAIKGLTVDGHDYIGNAIENGATKIICEDGNFSVETVIVKDTKTWLQEYLVSHFEKKINTLHLIGVTGTNGKTTTCFLTYQMLEKLGIQAAYIGTIGFYYGTTKRTIPNTTPEIVEIYSMLLEAIHAGVTHVVMEVSSHSLIEKRIAGLEFSTVLFTNLTEDHLDFHKTMENYLNAKLLLLEQLKPDGVILVNKDSEYGKYFEQKNYQTFGFQESNYQIERYEDTKIGTNIKFSFQGKSYEVETNLKGKFNVYNYLSSLAILHHASFSIREILSITSQVFPPKGRAEIVSIKDKMVIIDYAHTPDAVEKILNAFRENKKGKIITIIGCGGDRDAMKRPIMGVIATQLSDYVIFTSDNPRTEDPNKILQDITSTLTSKNFEICIDRREAIGKGIDLIQHNDLLFLLGKGHENYQIIGKEKIHFDDKEEVENYIKKKNLM